MPELILKEEVYRIVGAGMEVYNELGNGFLEAVYQEALEIEFASRSIAFEAQKELPILYKGIELKRRYKADFLVMDSVIVEIKATSGLIDEDQSQLLNYLSASRRKVGVLMNFGAPKNLEWKRMVL